ncbi:MAG TPA: hypothetical protein ENN80_05230, partial [Candidatus Hydrogenedentes bacterium]|nr:hypothetical protein [Candidatus Hydrogenedentota bacterium]
TIQQVLDAGGNLWAPRNKADILVLGDSFANIYSLGAMGWGEGAGLAAQLSAALDRPIDAIVVNDSGAHATRQQLARELAGGRNRLADKKLVIWEFAMRELAVGDWKTDIQLELRKAKPPKAVQREPVTVRGTIRAVTRPPKPGSVPYRDCLIAVHLSDVEVHEGAYEVPHEVIVFLWGMIENRWTHAADWRTGRHATLEVMPWEQVQAEYGSFNRIELEDNALLYLDTFWALEPGLEPSALPEVEQEQPAERPSSPALTEQSGVTFLEDIAAKSAALAAEDRTVLRGKDGWLFFGPELRSLSVGPFWGERATAVTRATNPEWADPMAAILDFHNQLQENDIELLLVPVPAKAVVYPEMVSDAVEVPEAGTPQRLDKHQRAFYNLLRNKGVAVLDLVPRFLAERDAPPGPVFCKQDTHWSGQGVAIAAEAIAGKIAGRPWLSEVPKHNYTTQQRTVTIQGDLARDLGEAIEPETLPLTFVGTPEGDDLARVEPWRESLILLLGDSHCLVFHGGGDMHARGAGLPDHLALELGFPVDLVGVRGSGATPA